MGTDAQTQEYLNLKRKTSNRHWKKEEGGKEGKREGGKTEGREEGRREGGREGGRKNGRVIVNPTVRKGTKREEGGEGM